MIIPIGCCVLPDQIRSLQAAGADYCELSISGAVMNGGPDAFELLKEQVAGLQPKLLAYNVFLPSSLKIVGPEVDRSQLESYVGQAFSRIRQLSVPGRPIVVMGSGRSRSIPETFSREVALDQLAEFLAWAGTLAQQHGVTLALEPLRRAESNVFNTISEAGMFLRERQLGALGLVADLYHMMAEHESLTTITAYADLIVHAHVADGNQRLPPGQSNYPIAEFLRSLRESGYQGACSIECTWQDFASEIGPALATMREQARQAGW
ncbi:MAG: sugar phosphate isomerase/epimerase [Herpetosiphonaceae bacterium]|nr:sugar phosphate isomerase/epimerase [Herpetosiphonaceae bacterium]